MDSKYSFIYLRNHNLHILLAGLTILLYLTGKREREKEIPYIIFANHLCVMKLICKSSSVNNRFEAIKQTIENLLGGGGGAKRKKKSLIKKFGH